MTTQPMTSRTLSQDEIARDLVAYFVLAISFTWLFWVPGALQAQGVLFFAIPEPVLFLGGAGPMLAALLLTGRRTGWRGIRRLLGRLLVWRVAWYWYVVALLTPFAIHYLPVLIADTVGWLEADFWSISQPLPMVALFLVVGLLLYSLEEIGWRGFALPHLQERHSAVRAGILLGIGWGVWHLPLLWVPGRYVGDAPVAAKIVALFAFMVIMSLLWVWLFNNTRGSLLMANFFHVFVNFSFATLALPEASSWAYELIAPAVMGGLLLVIVLWRFGGESMSSQSKVTWSALQHEPVSPSEGQPRHVSNCDYPA